MSGAISVKGLTTFGWGVPRFKSAARLAASTPVAYLNDTLNKNEKMPFVIL